VQLHDGVFGFSTDESRLFGGSGAGCQEAGAGYIQKIKERHAMSHLEIQRLENQFPSLSTEAFAAARRRVMESGQSVLQSEGGFVIRVFPETGSGCDN
jgi:hypothetical protein